MLTTAVTAAITAVLTWAGIPPGPYIAGVWVGVKVVLVAALALAGLRVARKNGRAAAAPPDRG